MFLAAFINLIGHLVLIASFKWNTGLVKRIGFFLVGMALVGGFVIVVVGTKWRFSDAGKACIGETTEFFDSGFLLTCKEGEGCYHQNGDQKDYKGLMFFSG